MPAAHHQHQLAFAHHWLVRHRGGERVLRTLRTLAPQAPVHTLIADPAYLAGTDFRLDPADDAPVLQSWLRRIPGARRHYPKLLPLLPAAARSVRVAPAPLVIVSDAALAKCMRFAPDSRVVCYCHSPMRYVWDLADQHRAQVPAPLRPLWPALTRRLRAADRAGADRVDRFIANSACVAERIRRHYDRDATVVHPPVDIGPPPGPAPRRDFYLCVGHHTPYKRLDLAVAAARHVGRELVVIGQGPDADRLRTPADPRIRFLGWRSDAEIRQHLAEARGLLFCGEEDFGIVPLEAQGQGCPVIAFGRGGARETVRDGQTGILFAEQTVECVAAAIERRERHDFDPTTLRNHAATFSAERFLASFQAAVSGLTD